MNSKKGLAIGQVFVFIVVAITFALILIFGYQVINSFLEKGEEVAFAQFKNSVETSVKRIYTEYGSSRVTDFNAPTKYEKICFINADYQAEQSEIPNLKDKLCEENELACSIWEEAVTGEGWDIVDQNVFLEPPAPNPIKVYKIDFENGKHYFCENLTNGKFSLVLMGRGDKTRIARVSN